MFIFWTIIIRPPVQFLARPSLGLLPSPPGAVFGFYPVSVPLGHEVALSLGLTQDATGLHLLLKAAQQGILRLALEQLYF